MDAASASAKWRAQSSFSGAGRTCSVTLRPLRSTPTPSGAAASAASAAAATTSLPRRRVRVLGDRRRRSPTPARTARSAYQTGRPSWRCSIRNRTGSARHHGHRAEALGHRVQRLDCARSGPCLLGIDDDRRHGAVEVEEDAAAAGRPPQIRPRRPRWAKVASARAALDPWSALAVVVLAACRPDTVRISFKPPSRRGVPLRSPRPGGDPLDPRRQPRRGAAGRGLRHARRAPRGHRRRRATPRWRSSSTSPTSASARSRAALRPRRRTQPRSKASRACRPRRSAGSACPKSFRVPPVRRPSDRSVPATGGRSTRRPTCTGGAAAGLRGQGRLLELGVIRGRNVATLESRYTLPVRRTTDSGDADHRSRRHPDHRRQDGSHARRRRGRVRRRGDPRAPTASRSRRLPAPCGPAVTGRLTVEVRSTTTRQH